MKKMRVQILCVIVSLCSGASLHCMFTSLRRVVTAGRPITSGMTPATAARLAAVQQQDTSTWSWIQSKWNSWLQGSPVQSKASQTHRTAPFGSRSFSTTIPQRASFFENFKSYFRITPLTAEEFYNEFETIIRGHLMENWKTPVSGKILRKHTIFTNSDLEAAKKLIDENENFVNTQIKNYMLEGRRTGYAGAYRLVTRGKSETNSTPIDMCLIRGLEHISALGADDFDFSFESMINLISLAEYIMNKGGIINEANKSSYESVYLDRLMKTYMDLYSDRFSDTKNDPTITYKRKYGIEAMKAMFKALDPILEKLIPEFKEKLHKAQQERLKIEQNPKAYKIEQENKKKFMEQKLKQKEDYLFPNGVFYPHQEGNWQNIEFNEKEYQEWLKNPRTFKFYFGPERKSSQYNTGRSRSQEYEEWFKKSTSSSGFKSQSDTKASSSGSNFKSKSDFGHKEEPTQTRMQSYQEKHLRSLLKLKPEEDIGEAYRKYAMKNHPDKLKILVNNGTMTRTDANEKIEDYKEINAAFKEYNDYKKQQLAKE
jgi:hypothetical protein